MMVYIALREDKSQRSEILGVFSNKNLAVKCCTIQPTFTRQTWEKLHDLDCWHNGHGLYVKIVEHVVQ
jgi:hypothetical protein